MKNITKNIPNLITLSRIPSVLLGLYFLKINRSLSLIFLSYWFLTDLFDGWLARKMQTESSFGKYADHIIDGFTLIIAYSYLLYLEKLSVTIKAAIILIIIRIILTAFIKYFLDKKLPNGTKPSNLGRLGSALQMIAIICYFAFPELFLIVFVPAFFLTMVSGVNYLRDFIKQKESRA